MPVESGVIKNNTFVKNAAGEAVATFRGGPIEFKATDFKSTLKNGVIDPSLSGKIEGISVNTNKEVAQSIGQKNGYNYTTPVLSVPKGLQLKQSGGNLDHYVIQPSYKMSVENFQGLVDKMNNRIEKLISK
jgi:hypothetical protein